MVTGQLHRHESFGVNAGRFTGKSSALGATHREGPGFKPRFAQADSSVNKHLPISSPHCFAMNADETTRALEGGFDSRLVATPRPVGGASWFVSSPLVIAFLLKSTDVCMACR